MIKELLQKDNTKQALNYITDMEEMTEELSFPCSTNNPAADILIGNKLGMSNIKAAAEKYNGAMNVKMDGTDFILSVLLIIP